MTDTASAADGLLSRVRVIEQQPLASRAEAYAGLRDELSRRLDGGAGRSEAEQA